MVMCLKQNVMQQKTRQPKTWQQQRHLAWLRYKCQCQYLGQGHITENDWNELWNTEDLWLRKGRGTTSLVMCAIDFTKEHSRLNVAIVCRLDLLRTRRQYQKNQSQTHIPQDKIIRKLT